MSKECRACGELVKATVVSSDGDSGMCVECWNELFANDPYKRVSVPPTASWKQNQPMHIEINFGQETK